MTEEPKVVEVNLWLPWKGPHKNQKAILNSNKRFKHIRCGRRFGKTSLVIKDVMKRLIVSPGFKAFYVGPTYRQAKMIAWQMVLETSRNMPKEMIEKVNESELYITLTNGSRLDIKGADNPDSLRGVGLDHCDLDEFAFQKKDVWTEIIQPALVDRKGTANVIGTPNGYDHFYELELTARENPKEWDVFHFTSYDNPTLDTDEINRRKNDITEEAFAQEYLAEYRKRTGLVYPEFSREKHVSTDVPEEFDERFAGIDFGYKNPTAILEIGRVNEKFYVHNEWYKPLQTNAQVIEYVKSIDVGYVYPDPAEPQRIQEMKNAGVYVREVSKFQGTKGKSELKGIDTVRELFKAGNVIISPRCKNLIYELETYAYAEDKQNRNAPERPIKDNDHACDALRYALMMNAGRTGRTDNTDYKLYNYTYE